MRRRDFVTVLAGAAAYPLLAGAQQKTTPVIGILAAAAPDNAGAGVWRTSARMHKLRTPKNLPGPELGLPGLSFQAWYEARHGAAAYDALDRIPRLDWAAYLDWYRKLVGVPVCYSTRLVRIEPVSCKTARRRSETKERAEGRTTRSNQ